MQARNGPVAPEVLVDTTLSTVRDLAPLRGAVLDALRGHGATVHLDDLVLGIHEEAVNALVHGGAPVTVRLSVTARGFVCDISDAGTGRAVAQGSRVMPPPEHTSGRGGALRSLAWRATHHRSGDRTTLVLHAPR